MDPFTISAAISGGKAVGDFLTGMFNKPKRFGSTPYAKRLKRIMQEGTIAGPARDAMLSNTARTAGTMTSRAKSNYAGRLAAMGAGGSIAGEEKLADLETKGIDRVTDVQRYIDAENAMAKSNAADTYAAAETQANEQAKDYKKNLVGNLLGGLANTATQFVGGKYQDAIRKSALVTEQNRFDAGQDLKREELDLRERDSVRDFTVGMAGVKSDTLKNPNVVSGIQGYLNNEISADAVAALLLKEIRDPQEVKNLLLRLDEQYEENFGEIGKMPVEPYVPRLKSALKGW